MFPQNLHSFLPLRKLFLKLGNTKGGKYHCTIDLLFDWFGTMYMTIGNFCFYLQNRLIQTSQTGGQLHSDTSPFSIPYLSLAIDVIAII